MKVLMLRDDKPGHFNQSEGVIAALRRLAPVDVERVDITAGPMLPARVVRALVAAGVTGTVPETLARVPDPDGGRPDLIVSAGGKTVLANVLLARRYGVPNIFSGSVRGLPEALFAAILHINPAFEGRPRYLVGLKPSALDPDRLGASPSHDPQSLRTVAALIGGPTEGWPFEQVDIETLAGAIARSRFNWRIATSRRTPEAYTTRLASVAKAAPDRVGLLDFAASGAGGVQELLAASDVATVTCDSVSMMSEAAAFRLPVIALEPARRGAATADQPYLDLMRRNGWYKPLPITDLSDDTLLRRAAQCTPMHDNHIDRLADRLKTALPSLFSG